MTTDASATHAGTPRSMRHILFVDDDPNVLAGLRDALRPRRREWRMTFVDGGDAAISLLEHTPIDVIVSDLRMPGMDGATLLAKVAHLQPDAVRIVLSGQADPATIGRVATVAHRILVKPSPIEEVTRVIERACVLLDVTSEVMRAAAGACALPSEPETYRELMELIGRSDATAAEIATVLERDIAMSAKVLHLANSAYFGLDKPVSDLDDAVTLLGHETIQAIVLTAEAFQKFDVPVSIAGFSLEHVQQRSLQVGRLARMLSQDDPATGDAFAAGLLLDVGLLVLAAHEPEYLADVLLAAEREGRPVHEIELERKGITHAEIGAHLFALWGLPHTIVEAVAHHHRPLRSPLPTFDTVAIVHIADALVADAETGPLEGPGTLSRIDRAYVERIGMTGRIAEWQRLATVELAKPQA
jgi:HD-like signal output (HDOD) protein/ActR/RegA family two-component response regulator